MAFVPSKNTVISIRISSLLETQAVVAMVLAKYEIANDPGEYAVVLRDGVGGWS